MAIGHQYDIGGGEFGQWAVDDLRGAMARELDEDGVTINARIERDLRVEETARLKQAVADGLAEGLEPILRELIAARTKPDTA